MSSIGTTCAYPAPAAPPLIPKTGPSEASRRQSTGLRPMWPSPCVSETEVVVFPSPAFVGVIAVTHDERRVGAAGEPVEHATGRPSPCSRP